MLLRISSAAVFSTSNLSPYICMCLYFLFAVLYVRFNKRNVRMPKKKRTDLDFFFSVHYNPQEQVWRWPSGHHFGTNSIDNPSISPSDSCSSLFLRVITLLCLNNVYMWLSISINNTAWPLHHQRWSNSTVVSHSHGILRLYFNKCDSKFRFLYR